MDNREFLIAKPQDEEGEFMVQDAEEEKRFKEARDDDNLVTPSMVLGLLALTRDTENVIVQWTTENS